MLRRLTLVLAAVLLAAAATLPLTSFFRASAQFTVECELAYEAVVRQGPGAGLAYAGMLLLTVDPNGSATGELVIQEGSIDAAGQINGRSVNLIFTLGQGLYIFGVGTALHTLSEGDCGGVLGGPFTGPEPGDSGDWIACTAPKSEAEASTLSLNEGRC